MPTDDLNTRVGENGGGSSSDTKAGGDEDVVKRFYLGGSTFSVYEEMARQLLAAGWTSVSAPAAVAAGAPTKASPHAMANRSAVSGAVAGGCDLLLGDRFHIPYATLRSEPVAPQSYFRGVRWVNYFEDSSLLTRKASMTRLLRAGDARHAEWLPQSFIFGGLPPGGRAAERCLVLVAGGAAKPGEVAAEEEKEDQSGETAAAAAAGAANPDDERGAWLAAAAADPSAVWIVKPNSGAKGKNIALARGPAEAAALLEALARPGSRTVYVVQRYVDRPLLLSHGRKFDVRVWVLALSSPDFRLYAFSQCSCRTASAPLDMADLSNTAAHLTNHCLQEHAEGFGRYEEGNEMWLPQLQEWLSSATHDNNNNNSSDDGDGGGVPSPLYGRPDAVEGVIIPKMREVIVRTLLCVRDFVRVPPGDPLACFQLFGYDLMVDASGDTVWLLEINGSPGIADRFLTPLVREMVRIVAARPPPPPEPATTVVGKDDTAAATAPGDGQGKREDDEERKWRLEDERMVLLWREGDPIPEGLSVDD